MLKTPSISKIKGGLLTSYSPIICTLNVVRENTFF